ncbi:extracellular solute-binding protein [Candidatus Izemoplasma sp. B36]|uniref:extracellular solute-binding protein n=1 Tax=Candidatus Izemoplasma sp. B36 TaxID=3242468 RepID=UPI0035583FA8
MKKRLFILLMFIMISLINVSAFKVDAEPLAMESNTSIVIQGNYKEKLDSWENESFSDNSDFSLTITPSDFINDLILTNQNNGYNHSVYQWNDDEVIDFEVNVPTKGLYSLSLDFYSISDNLIDTELGVKINGKTQYLEASQVILYKLWEQKEGFPIDRFGNDFYGEQTQVYKWIHQDLQDPMGLYSDPLLFELNSGMNTISMNKVKGAILLGDITISGKTNLLTYAEYSNEATLLTNEVYDTYEAEIPDSKNSTNIQPGVSRDALVTPFDVSELKLNHISGLTFNSERETISYLINVETSGYYNITLKVLQNEVTNSTVYRALKINGEIPFLEAKSLPFNYDMNWQNVTLGGDSPYLFYFEEGQNEISFCVDLSLYQDTYYNVNQILDYINDLSLQVRKLTGNQVDENRDWEISDYIPDIQNQLLQKANELDEIYSYFEELTYTDKLSEILSSLKIAIRNINYLAEEPNEIPVNISLLSTSNESISAVLGNVISMMLDSPLSIDKFYIHTDVEIEKAEANFFTRTWLSIKRFFLSFFDERYQTVVSDDELVVWVNRNKQYTDLVQKMADDIFTPNTGIKVNVSVMASEGKLVLANSAGTNPDVALGVASWLPYDLGMRGAIYDLTQFGTDPDFNSILGFYHEQSLIPMIYDNGLYGLPDTENFYVLYYREDILTSLNIPIPETWDDVAEIMPILKRYALNFYMPLSSATSLKSFDSTLPFLFQYGSSVYDQSGFYVDMENEETVKALEVMTELYTIYSIDTTVTSFFNDFRLGLSPIGVGDFGMYVTLLNAAPDIQGLWKIALLPGVENIDGSIDRSAPGAQTANMIFQQNEKLDESWRFLKWWSSTETQIDFTNLLLSTLGKEYLWNTANIEAFNALNINEEDLDIIQEQWTYLRELPKVPGSYQVELEISNIWNSVVLDRENLRVLLNDSIIRMDKEIHKKMSEFGYMDANASILKPYILADVSIIDRWKAGDFDE